MDIQFVIVGIIILTACLYVGRQIFLKVKSTTSKSSCASDCGCDSKSGKIPTQIRRN
jgi:FeoB-associated Cys-rich membrane protein